MDQDEVINAFVTYLQKIGFPDLKVESWPDKVNRKSFEIDAIAGCLRLNIPALTPFQINAAIQIGLCKQLVGLKKNLLYPFFTA